MTSIGERVTELRTENGLTKTQLASRLGIGESAIDHIESNRRKPSLKTAVRMANIFSVSLDELIGTDESIFESEKETA